MYKIVTTLLFLMVFAGCTTPKHNTLILAHGAGAGFWSKNSRHAVIQSLGSTELKERFHGIEVDIVLTKDNVPVLAHDPWIDQNLCTRIDNKPIGYRLIKNIYFDDLTRNYRCGGITNSDYPNASTLSETILGFDEFLSYAKNAPDMIIYLDLKIQPDLTASSEAYAKAIFERWESAGIRNTLYIEGATKDILSAYSRYSHIPYKPVLSYPPFYSNENWTMVGAEAAIKTFLNSSYPLEKAQQAQAEALASPVIVMSKKAQHVLQSEDIEVIIFTPNSRKAFDKACHSNVDLLITDYPNLGPCT